jgi:hypothetical protein
LITYYNLDSESDDGSESDNESAASIIQPSSPDLPKFKEKEVDVQARREYEHSILHACGAAHASNSEQTKPLQIVEALGLLPCSIITANGREENTSAQRM